MTTSTPTTVPSTTTSPEVPTVRRRPSAVRRTFVAAASTVALVLPVVFTVNLSRMLLTGVETEHRFHQATGQGLVLCALWLGALVPLVLAGWRGEQPSTAAGLRHLTLIGVGAAAAVASPGGGAPALMVVLAIPGALLWLALPRRPRLRDRIEVHPVLLPLALVVTAVLAPYAVDQLALQNAATGHHAANPHFFDMAWVSGVVMVLALLAALVRPARSLAWWVGGCCSVIGAAGLAFGEPAAWSAGVLGLGGLTLAVQTLTVTVAGTRRENA